MEDKPALSSIGPTRPVVAGLLRAVSVPDRSARGIPPAVLSGVFGPSLSWGQNDPKNFDNFRVRSTQPTDALLDISSCHVLMACDYRASTLALGMEAIESTKETERSESRTAWAAKRQRPKYFRKSVSKGIEGPGMWINPKYADSYPASPAPPQDEGEPIGVFQRSQGREELRVVLKTFKDHPYVSIRVWERDQAGEFWPVKGKGVSIRISEAADVAEALGNVEAGIRQDDRRSSKPAARSLRRDQRRQPLDIPSRDEGGFSES